MKPNAYYHVYNHANGDENLFRSDENYYYFLNQWAKYIEPVAGTYAYCLLPNHFHVLIKTHDINTLEVYKNLQGISDDHFKKVVIQSFSNLFNSYTKAFNKYYDRRGSLFMSNFKRKEIYNDKYLSAIVTYIHRNPVHHGFRRKVGDWPHSSYDVVLNANSTKLNRTAVREWYDTPNNYKNAHKMEVRIPDTSLFIDY